MLADSDYRYCAFGLNVSSQVPLTELSPAISGSSAAADISIHFENLPERSESIGQSHSIHVDGDDVSLTIDRVARYRIRGGKEISIDPYQNASARNVRLFLLGSVFGVLCHQRGLLPLHANAIVVNGQAVVFAGQQGIGKSTLAAYYQSLGYGVLCDDVCVVSFDEGGRPLAWPGMSRLKLWRDAAEAFGYDSRKLERVVDELDKYNVPLKASVAKGPFPAARMYILSDRAAGAATEIVPLTGSTAVQAIMSNTYRNIYLQPMRLTGANFVQATLLAKSARIFAAPRCRGYDVFAQEAARLEHHFTRGEPAAGLGGRDLRRTMTPIRAS
jgi:hypothetical protein